MPFSKNTKLINLLYMRRTASETVYKTIAQFFPGLGSNAGHWRHLMRHYYSLDGTSSIASILIGAHQIAKDYNEIRKIITENYGYHPIERIKRFWEEVYPYDFVKYEKYTYEVDDKCEVFEYIEEVEYIAKEKSRCSLFEFPPEIIQLRKDELAGKFKGESRYYFDTQLKVTKNNKSKLITEDKLEAQIFQLDLNKLQKILGSKTLAQMQTKFLNYLNNLPSNRFSKIVKYVDQARKAMYDTYVCPYTGETKYEINPESWYQQGLILDSIEEQPQPFYKHSPKGNTVRAFQINPGLQIVARHLRSVLTQDWVEVDLAQAHLAIVAKLWNIPEVTEFLKTGESIWPSLLEWMGYQKNDHRIKVILKPFLYSVIYGMSFTRLENELIGITSKQNGYKQFTSHPIVAALIEARKHRTEQIKKAGVYKTLLGNQIKVTCYRKNGKFESNVNTILSQEANEMEMFLMSPIIHLAEQTDEFDVVLYQFDGCSLAFKDNTKKDRWLKKIKEQVDKMAKDLGFEIGLDIK